jgi:hypothetical protein
MNDLRRRQGTVPRPEVASIAAVADRRRAAPIESRPTSNKLSGRQGHTAQVSCGGRPDVVSRQVSGGAADSRESLHRTLTPSGAAGDAEVWPRRRPDCR